MYWENETHTVLFEVSESTPFRTRHRYGDITTVLSKLLPERTTAYEVDRLVESWVKCLGVYESDQKRLLRRSRRNRYAYERIAVVKIYCKNAPIKLGYEKYEVYRAIYDGEKVIFT